MKKILSLLLTVTMLLTMIPSVIVNVSAETAYEGTWSFNASFTAPAGAYAIPVDTVSASCVGGVAIDRDLLSWVAFGSNLDTDPNYDSGAIADGAFEVVGQFVPTTVSQFTIRGKWNNANWSDFIVSFRKAGTDEWVTINPHGLTGKQGGTYITCKMPDTLADQEFDGVRMTNNKGRAFIFGVKFFTTSAPTGWSAGSDLNTAPSGAYWIPVETESATCGSETVSRDLFSITSFEDASTQYQKASLSVGAFEVIGRFTPTNVSRFIIHGYWKASQYSDFLVSFRNAETGKWITVRPHAKKDQNGSYFEYIMPASLADQEFDSVRLTSYLDQVFVRGIKLFTDSTGWSFATNFALSEGMSWIPVDSVSAACAGTAIDRNLFSLKSFNSDSESYYDSGSGIAEGAFVAEGTFEAQTVTGFTIRGRYNNANWSDFIVSFRKAGTTDEWVTINPHGQTGQKGAFLTYTIPASLANQEFDSVRLVNYKSRAYIYGVRFFTDTLPIGWSASSILALPTDSHVIPITVTEGATTYKDDHPDTNNASAEVIDWSKLPLDSFGAYCYLQTFEFSTFKVIGSFAEPTTVSSFMFKTNEEFPERAQFRVSLRKAGTEEWVQIAPHTLSGYNNGDKGQYVTYSMPAEHADQKFDQVKLTKDSWQWVQLYGVLFFTENETGLHSVPATATDPSDLLKDAWGYSNATQINTGANASASAPYSTVAKLSTPTVIHSVQLTGGANFDRVRGSIVYASVDGENWDELYTFSIYKTDFPQYSVVDADCTNAATATKAYSYIKIEQQDSLKAYDWSVVGIAVYGWTAVSMEGYQTKIDSSTYSVRFVSTVKGLGHEGVGYEITATGNKSWDVNDTTVYSTIYETVNGTPNTVAAPDGRYFYVADVTNISIANYGEITFTIKPYVISNGTKLYGEAVTWTFEDGAFVNPQA